MILTIQVPSDHMFVVACFQTPLPEQEGPSEGTFSTIEMFSSREMAYHMTLYDWELFSCVQEVRKFGETSGARFLYFFEVYYMHMSPEISMCCYAETLRNITWQ